MNVHTHIIKGLIMIIQVCFSCIKSGYFRNRTIIISSFWKWYFLNVNVDVKSNKVQLNSIEWTWSYSILPALPSQVSLSDSPSNKQLKSPPEFERRLSFVKLSPGDSFNSYNREEDLKFLSDALCKSQSYKIKLVLVKTQ